MGNKLDPHTETVTDEPTLITDVQTRKQVVIKNKGTATIELHHRDDFEYGEGWPLEAGETWADDKSYDNYFGICDTGLSSDVLVWEVA
jgi:hypothetical protein